MAFVSHDTGLSRASDWLGVPRRRRATSFSAMVTTHQDILRFVDSSGEVRRSAVIWMQLLHQITVRPRYFARRRALFEAQYLIRLILGNRTPPGIADSARTAAPRVLLTLSCATPSGKPAVEIRL